MDLTECSEEHNDTHVPHDHDGSRTASMEVENASNENGEDCHGKTDKAHSDGRAPAQASSGHKSADESGDENL